MANVGFVSKGFKGKKDNLKDRNKHEALLVRLSKVLTNRKGASRGKARLFKSIQEVLDKLRSVKTVAVLHLLIAMV